MVRVLDRSKTSPWYSLRCIFVSEVFLHLAGLGTDARITKTDMLRGFRRGRAVVLDALEEMVRQGALVVQVGMKRGRLCHSYALPNPMDTGMFSGFVRQGAEGGLDVAFDGWGRDRGGAFRYEAHVGEMEGRGQPLDADFAWCPDWAVAQDLIETSGIELLASAGVG